MKKYLLALLLSLVCFMGYGMHTKGGWMFYEYLGPGIQDPTKHRYRIVLKQYMICNPSSGQLDQSVIFSFFNGSTNQHIENQTAPLVEQPNINNCSQPSCNPCILNIPTICYKYTTYEIIKELAPSPGGYVISYQRCCRIPGIANIVNSSDIGDTWTIKIPGNGTVAAAPINSSPLFIPNDTALICANNFFQFNFTATDPDGDSLLYSFAPAYIGASMGTPVPPNGATPPPYQSVPYSFPFNSFQPLGAGVTMDPNTGVVSGIAPASGVYVVSAVVYEYRNGQFIGESRKSLHVQVAPCAPIVADLNPQYITCDGFTMSFQNNAANSAINSYYWNFGVPSLSDDTSLLPTPTFTYPDTGVYLLTLIVNRGQSCTDTATAFVHVYPGFFPGFRWVGQCKNSPITFYDTSRTNYGFIDTWSWNFGDPLSQGDTSHNRNAVYSYANPGTYDVSLTVTNSKGCIKTITTPVTIIDNPVIDLPFRDTSFCGRDTIQLHATANYPGTYSWTPLTNIIGANTADPFVFPTATTIYRVTMDAGGCVDTDSVIVRPTFDMVTTANASATNICEDDTLTLTATSNRGPTVYTWTPSATLESPNSQTTRAFPATTTTYTVTGRWGNNCIDTDSKTIVVKPLAVPNAGPDDAFCPGANGVLLNASGGDTYIWSPATGLSATNIPNPRAVPAATTTYAVSVGVSGCSKRRTDSVTVSVRPVPSLQLTNDTLICSIDTLQLTAVGTGTIQWTPNYNINNQNTTNPLVSPDIPTTYVATIIDGAGCSTKDSVFVDVRLVVSIDAGNDTTICLTDSYRINTISDALRYQWSPAAPLDDASKKNPIATPDTATTFYVIGNIGKCQSIDSVKVRVVPYPQANAGPDSTICFGETIQLNATGGSIYTWSPPFFLNNPNIPDPVSNTNKTIRYTVTVSDILGCPKPVTSSVLISVYPKVTADAGPRDTSVVINQPLQLQATGGITYLWSPATGLNNRNISNPVAKVQKNQQYVLTAIGVTGCMDTDTIDVTVYQVTPGLYVPNAWTPNKDGINDVLRPIAIGMKQINYFRVYNRWGVLMFESDGKLTGWDGRYKGILQDPAVFVWMVEGVDYQENVIRQKGIATLIK